MAHPQFCVKQKTGEKKKGGSSPPTAVLSIRSFMVLSYLLPRREPTVRTDSLPTIVAVAILPMAPNCLRPSCLLS